MKEKLEKLLAEADRLYAISMDDNTPEDLSDKAYSEYHEILHEIADWLNKFSMGMIDKKTAFRMAVHKKDEISALVKRWRGF